MNIGHDRIASVVVGDQALVFGQADGKLALTQPTDHPALTDYKVEDVGRALETLTLQSVKADADVTDAEAGHAVFTTGDGLAVTVQVFHADKDVWARFSTSAMSDKAKAEADRLNARIAGWTYQIGSWKEKSLVPTIDDLKAEQPATQAGQTSAPAEADQTSTPDQAGQASPDQADQTTPPESAGQK
jgi:hypothetical protein